MAGPRLNSKTSIKPRVPAGPPTKKYGLAKNYTRKQHPEPGSHFSGPRGQGGSEMNKSNKYCSEETLALIKFLLFASTGRMFLYSSNLMRYMRTPGRFLKYPLSVTTPLLKPWSVSSLISLPFVNSKLIFECSASCGSEAIYEHLALKIVFCIKNSFLHFFY